MSGCESACEYLPTPLYNPLYGRLTGQSLGGAKHWKSAESASQSMHLLLANIYLQMLASGDVNQ